MTSRPSTIQQFPAATTIVAVTVGIFVLMVAAGAHVMNVSGELLRDWGSNFAPDIIDRGQWWRLVTCMFLHGNLIHIGFNMWVFWDIGRLVERENGSLGLVLAYFLTGIAASITSLGWHNVASSVGASGAVFGMVGVVLGMIVCQRETATIPALKRLRNSLGMFLVYNVMLGLAVPAIDMAGHVGGLVAGFIFGGALVQPWLAQRIRDYRRREVLLGVTGSILLVVSAALVARIPGKLAHIDRFWVSQYEYQAYARHDTLLKAALANNSLQQLGTAIKSEVLPLWGKHVQALETGLERASREQDAQYFRQRRHYADVRRRAYENEADYYAQPTPAKKLAAEQSLQEADELLDKLLKK